MRRAMEREGGKWNKVYTRDYWRCLLRGLKAQLHAEWFFLLILYAPVVVLFLVLMCIEMEIGVQASIFTRDPVSIGGLAYYAGSVSNLGVLIWSASAAGCFLGCSVLFSLGVFQHTATFMLFGGLITLMFVVDDLFLLHESVFPRFLGISEYYVYTAYLIALLAFLYRFNTIIRSSRFLLLMLALASFAISIAADMVEHFAHTSEWVIIEEAMKMSGIVGWTAYFMRFVFCSLSSSRTHASYLLIESQE